MVAIVWIIVKAILLFIVAGLACKAALYCAALGFYMGAHDTLPSLRRFRFLAWGLAATGFVFVIIAGGRLLLLVFA